MFSRTGFKTPSVRLKPDTTDGSETGFSHAPTTASAGPDRFPRTAGAAEPGRLTPGERTSLVVVLLVGLALRLIYFVSTLRTPGYIWEDPDGYMRQALRLAGTGGWQWTFDAVTYTINGQRHALPPMYSVFLSLFAQFPGFPLSAQVAQMLLAIPSIWMVFWLGRLIHSPRAGLIGAAGYALWVPSIFNVWSTSQETLYIPLILLAFVLSARAVARNSGPAAFALAGLVFGVAALTRSMPIFFVGPAAIGHVLFAPNRRRAAAQALALLAGFLLVTAPYVVGLSRHFGELTVIDTHGSIHFEAAAGERAPGLAATAAALWQELARRPAEYLIECAERARSLLHVNGGRILQTYVVAGTRAEAMGWKVLVHLGSDAPLILIAALAVPGAVLCRRPRIAAWFLLWSVVNIGIASVGGFGGARLRAPFEPLWLVLAAAVCAGGWQRPHRGALAIAMLAGVVLSAAVLPQVPRSIRAWPDYGIRWPSNFDRTSGNFHGTAGFNVPAYAGLAALQATPSTNTPLTVEVRAGGVPVRAVHFAHGDTAWIRVPWPARGLAFLELRANDPAGAPASVKVTLPPR